MKSRKLRAGLLHPPDELPGAHSSTLYAMFTGHVQIPDLQGLPTRLMVKFRPGAYETAMNCSSSRLLHGPVDDYSIICAFTRGWYRLYVPAT